MTDDAATMEEMRERIAFLEKELVEAKLQAALAKSNEERLIHEALQMKTMIAELTDDENVIVQVSVPTKTACHPPSPNLNPNSCASGLNLIALASCDSYGSLGASSMGLRRKRVFHESTGGSMMSIESSSFLGPNLERSVPSATQELRMMLGGTRLVSNGSSFSRTRGGSTTRRLDDRRFNDSTGSTKNEEWDIIKD